MKKSTVPAQTTASTRKKRGDTPEKLSPAASAEPNDAKRVDVIWDEALESLRIKDDLVPPFEGYDNLEDRQPFPTVTVAVKKRKQISTNHDTFRDSLNTEVSGALSNRKKAVVVKVAPETTKVEEFIDEKFYNLKEGKPQLVTTMQQAVSIERKQRFPVFVPQESSSIIHHEKRMVERHRVQQHLMSKLNRLPNELTMNIETREKEFQRDMVDRLLPYAEMKGHGYWKGAEFWRQHIWIGGEERGIFDTPGQVQRGYPSPIERANLSNAIRSELGLPASERPVPTKLTERFKHLKKGFALGGDLEPHTPDLRELIVLPYRPGQEQMADEDAQLDVAMESENIPDQKPEGNVRIMPGNGADMLSRIPDIFPPALLLGPALSVCDQILKPNQQDGENLFEDPGVMETRLVFECMAGGAPCKNTVALANAGSTVIFYSWRRLPVENVFKPFSTQPVLSLLASNPTEVYEDISKVPPLPPVPPQRFYFDATDGVLLPGAKINLPVVFKSALAGVFSERWLLTPMPPAMPPIIVHFKGVAAQPDIHATARAQLTAELSKREAIAVCRALVRSLVDGVRTPPRPSSPIGAPGRRQRALAFRQQNSDIYFDWQKAMHMEQLWNSACQLRSGQPPPTGDSSNEGGAVPPPPPGDEWDLSVETLYNAVTEQPEEEDIPMDEDALEQILAQLNENVAQLGFSEMSAQCDQKGTAGRILLSVAADTVSEQALALRNTLGLPPPPDIQQRPPSSLQQPATTAGPGRGGQGGQAAGGKVTSAMPAAHSRGSATRGARQGAAHPSTSESTATPPNELGIIRSPSDLSTDPAQALVVAKYVDKLQTTSRSRIREIINSLVDNVADLVDKRDSQMFPIPK